MYLRLPPELIRATAHCIDTYMHHKASRSISNEEYVMKFENKQANPTIHYNFMIIIVVIMKIVGHFMILRSSARAYMSCGVLTVPESITWGAVPLQPIRARALISSRKSANGQARSQENNRRHEDLTRATPGTRRGFSEIFKRIMRV